MAKTKASEPWPRFWRKVERAAGCWNWMGHKSPDGYGVICGMGETRAHRLSLRLHGVTIPPGLIVMHLCDNRACVNPEHLRIGTHAENIQDRDAKGRTATGDRNGSRRYPRKGSKNPTAKLTEADVVEIRRLRAETDESLSSIGKRYGVTNQVISSIEHRRSWRHVP